VEHLDRVTEAAKYVLRVDGVGLLRLDEHDQLCLGASNAASAALERGQQQLDAGPAIECVRSAATAMVSDLASHLDYASLWQWLDDSSKSPSQPDGPPSPRAVVSAPIRVRGSVTGTLNVLGLRPESWSADQVQAIEAYANIIGLLLRLAAHPGPPRT
jgi:GAF domain-containing protein